MAENMFPPDPSEMDEAENEETVDYFNDDEEMGQPYPDQQMPDWGNNFMNDEQEFQQFQSYPEQNGPWRNDFLDEEQQYQLYPEDEMPWGMYQPQEFQYFPQEGMYLREEFGGEAEEEEEEAENTAPPPPTIGCQCKIKKKKQSKPFQPKSGIQHGLGPLLEELIQAVLTYQPEEDDICQFLALYVKAKIDQKNEDVRQSRTLRAQKSLEDIRKEKRFSDDVYKRLGPEEDPGESFVYEKKRSTDENAARLENLLNKKPLPTEDEDVDKILEDLKELQIPERLSAVDVDGTQSIEDLENLEYSGDEEEDAEEELEDLENEGQSVDQDENEVKSLEDIGNQRFSAGGTDRNLVDTENQKRLSEEGNDEPDKEGSDENIQKESIAEPLEEEEDKEEDKEEVP